MTVSTKCSGKGRKTNLEYDKKSDRLGEVLEAASSDEEVSVRSEPRVMALENPDLILIGQIMSDLNSHPVVVLGNDKLPEDTVRKCLKKLELKRKYNK